LELIYETDYLTQDEFLNLHNEAGEILKILKSIILTTKKSYNS